MEGKITPTHNDDAPLSPVKTILSVLLGILALFFASILAGFIGAHLADGPAPMNAISIGIVAGFTLLMLACAFGAYRLFRQQGGFAQPITKKEKRNRQILLGCGVLGGVIGMVLVLGSPDSPATIYDNSPIPAAMAIILAIIMAVLVPIISIIWHRNADEQEAYAYKEGALYAIYVYMIGAPTWWILWRGGLVPEPNGVIIYYATILTLGLVWLWKKYG
jgi:hypothetical protein